MTLYMLQEAQGTWMTQQGRSARAGQGHKVGLATKFGIAIGSGAVVAAMGLAFGPSTVLLEAAGVPETMASQWGIAFNVALVSVFALLGGFATKRFRWIFSGLAGGVFGLHVGKAMAAGEFGLGLGLDAAFTMLIGIVLIMIGLLVSVGYVHRGLGEAMELERSGPDTAMMRPSLASTLAEGGLLCVLAVMTLLEPGSPAMLAACAMGAGLLAIMIWGHVRAARAMDEMNRQVWTEGLAAGGTVFILGMVGWAIGQMAGLLPQASAVGMIGFYYLAYLGSTITLIAVRYPSMLAKRSEQGEEADA